MALPPLYLAQAENPNVHLVYWLIGGFLVWNYAQGRFTSQKSIRSSTTYLRYISAAASYVAAMLGIYAGLTAIIGSDGFEGLMKVIGLESGGQNMEVTAPLLSALLLTTAMPNIPILQRLDEALRTFCERLGNVPWEVESLSNRLMLADYFVPESIRSEILHQTQDIVEGEKCFTEQQSLMGKWLQVSALIAQMQKWNESENVRYLRFYGLYKSELLDLEERWNWTRKGIKNKGCLEDFQAEIEKLRRQCCKIIARGVLFSEKSKHDRVQRLEKMGFQDVMPAIRQFVTIHELTAVGLIVFVLLAGSSILTASTNEDMGRTLQITVMVAAIYACAVWAAIYPKVMSPVWRVDEHGHRPWMFYVLAGLIAVGLRFVVAFFFNLFTNGFEPLLALELSMWSIHYSLIVFASAVGFTALADNFPLKEGETQPKWLRWTEGAILALLLAVSAYVVQEWRSSVFENLPSGQTAEIMHQNMFFMNAQSPGYEKAVGAIQGMKFGAAKFDKNPLEFPLRSALIGFMLGIWVPSWYRRGMVVQGKMNAMVAEEEAEALAKAVGASPSSA